LYDDIPHPLIARWDEQRATIRTAVYDSGNLDIELVTLFLMCLTHSNFYKVTMNIRARHMPTNITHNNANYKDRHKDEETSYLAEPKGHTFSNQTITSEQVSPSNIYPAEYHRKLLNRLLFLSQMDKILRFVDDELQNMKRRWGDT
jgi:hypothetical protein